MLIGYVRVSTAEQNSARQEVLMRELGVEKVYLDKASGKNANRPQLQEMLSFARQGDTIVVESISRFARNTRDLLELMERKSVRAYTDQEISPDDRQVILHAAMAVLTAGNQQLYTILDITDDKLKQKLSISCDNQPFKT